MKYFYTKDHLGSIREVLGANGTVVSSSRYDAWGVRTTQGAQDAASFGFTGHLEHKELGLVFTLYRAYDPATGRWLSRDPIGESGGINLYGYVSNNPVNLRDPWGLCEIGKGGEIPFGTIIATGVAGLHGFAYLWEINQAANGNGNFPSDKFYHCLVSCRMAKLAGSSFAEMAGNYQEASSNDIEDSADDQCANSKGRSAAEQGKDCGKTCKELYP